jgi:hypothetical protein
MYAESVSPSWSDNGSIGHITQSRYKRNMMLDMSIVIISMSHPVCSTPDDGDPLEMVVDQSISTLSNS